MSKYDKPVAFVLINPKTKVVIAMGLTMEGIPTDVWAHDLGMVCAPVSARDAVRLIDGLARLGLFREER